MLELCYRFMHKTIIIKIIGKRKEKIGAIIISIIMNFNESIKRFFVTAHRTTKIIVGDFH